MATFHLIGDAFGDLFCFLKDNEFPEPGGDVELNDPVKALAGGSGVNTATHLQSLLLSSKLPDQPVSLYTALNQEDDYGKLLLDHAEQHGFKLINCRPTTSSFSTGHCLAIVADHERSFMTHRGCIAEFSPNHIDTDRMIAQDGPIHIHVAGYYNMPHFWNGNLTETLLHIQKARQEHNRATCFSMVPQHDASGVWDGGIDQVIASCLDFLVLNMLEVSRIMRRGSGEAVDEQHNELDAMVRYFQQLSPTTTVVVTRGAKGAVAFGNGEVLAELIEAVAVDVLDPTGAGDAFAAGFLQGIWAWKNDNKRTNDISWPRAAIREGLRWGCAAGTATVSIKGASIPADRSIILLILERQNKAL